MIVLNPIIEARKQAQRERYRKWRNTAAGREKALENSRRWKEENSEQDAETRRKYRKKKSLDRRLYSRERNAREEVRLKRRDKSLWSNYRITLADYEEMLARQGGLCAVCRQEKGVHVDHCHETGRVRGILCSSCNKGLGYFKDNTSLLSAAMEYLK